MTGTDLVELAATTAVTSGTASSGLLGWLASSLGIEVSFRTEMRFPTGKPAYSEVVGVDLAGMRPEVRDTAAQRVHSALAPASKDRLEEWVSLLHAGTKHRNDDTMTLKVILKLYVKTLGKYPADVAKQACEEALSNGDGWFPPVADLEAKCRALTAPREMLLRTLQGWRETPRDLLEAWRLEDEAQAVLAAAEERWRAVGPGSLEDPARKAVFDEVSEMERGARSKLRAAAILRRKMGDPR